MRKSMPLLLLVLAFANPTPLAAQAAIAPDTKGSWLTMDCPVAAVRAGEEARVGLSLVNHGLAPQRANLSVEDIPPGWTAELRGGGQATFKEG